MLSLHRTLKRRRLNVVMTSKLLKYRRKTKKVIFMSCAECVFLLLGFCLYYV